MHAIESIPVPKNGTATPGLTSAIAEQFHEKGIYPQILSFIKNRGSYGATADEVHRNLGIRQNSVSAAVSRLGKESLLHNTRTCRRTSSGRPAIVWIISKP